MDIILDRQGIAEAFIETGFTIMAPAYSDAHEAGPVLGEDFREL